MSVVLRAGFSSTAMSHQKLLKPTSAVSYSSVSTADDGQPPARSDDFHLDMKDLSADTPPTARITKKKTSLTSHSAAATTTHSPARPPPISSSSSSSSSASAKGNKHAHFENADSGSHEHGGYHYSNGHPHHSHDLHSDTHTTRTADGGGTTSPTSTTNGGGGGGGGGRSISPLSPRMSPRVCGGLGPKAQQQLDKAGRRIEKENAAARRKLWIVSILCLCFMTLEIIGGFIANSLAIMTDAAHLLSDLASFLISIFALWLATRAPTSRLSFGFHRAEILGALISVIMIWLLTGILVYEAVQRIREPEDVNGKMMFIVATCGLAVNLVMGFILYQSGHQHSHGLGGGGGHGHSHGGAAEANTEDDEDDDEDEDEEHGHSHAASHSSSHTSSSSAHGHSHSPGAINDGLRASYQQSELPPALDKPTHPKAANINVSAAFVHVLGDALQSVGVMIAAALIWYSDDRWSIADPICTFVFSVLVLFTTARLVRQSVGVLMEGAPEGIDPAVVEEALHGVDGVLEVHDLHVWSLSVGKPSLSVHLLTRDNAPGVLREATLMLGKKFNIHHSTIQVEREGDEIACNEHWK